MAAAEALPVRVEEVQPERLGWAEAVPDTEELATTERVKEPEEVELAAEVWVPLAEALPEAQ